MRKRYKLKKHSCSLCKPHKMGKAHRWKAKEADLLKIFEQDKQEISFLILSSIKEPDL
ncbi:MAG: hypothetical protein Q8P83_01460 [bacterium]|nr:hypothetical protein [bacterium]